MEITAVLLSIRGCFATYYLTLTTNYYYFVHAYVWLSLYYRFMFLFIKYVNLELIFLQNWFMSKLFYKIKKFLKYL